MWYFKGRRKKYKSPYTGKEVDAAVKKSADTTATATEIDTAVAYVNSLTATANELDTVATYVGSLTSTAAEIDNAVSKTPTKYTHITTVAKADKTLFLTLFFETTDKVHIETSAQLGAKLNELGYAVTNLLKNFTYNSGFDYFSSTAAYTFNFREYHGVYPELVNDEYVIRLRASGRRMQIWIADNSITTEAITNSNMNVNFDTIISDYIVASY